MIPVVYLARLCSRWGGRLIRVSRLPADDGVDGRTAHPLGTCMIDLTTRTVYATRHANPGTIIHEMGHVFLAEGHPATTYEPHWLGWEICLARRARCYRAWSKQNESYGVDYDGRFCDWGDLDQDARRSLIADRLRHAVSLGIVSPSGVPLVTVTVVGT